jgi:mono/diheme cytochrome c family protein
MHQPRYHLGGLKQSVSGGFDVDQMVDVRLNGGPWTTVEDANVTCAYPERAYSCIDGPYYTLRFSMDASQLGGGVDGSNTVEFRYNGIEEVRSGFRVLYIGFMRPGQTVDEFVPAPKPGHTENLIDNTTFERWDPQSWTAPSDADASAGESLWKAENSLQNMHGEDIVAGCASCHANDGRDLEYFAFSNKVIEARSRGHGLTTEEAQDVAAYIRSQTLRNTRGNPAQNQSPGRPWDPPYQPGPTGFGPDGNSHPDEVDAFYWAAGAGLEWVFDRDIQTLKYAFPASGDPANPGGIATNPSGDLPWTRYKVVSKSEWGSNGGTNRGTAVNMREIPLSVQLPDWNNWLPDIHPHDGLEKLYDGSEHEENMETNLLDAFQSGNLGQIEQRLNYLNASYFQNIKRNLDPNDPSSGTANNLTEIEFKHAIQGGSQHRAVKAWYFQHSFDVENKADELHCDGSNFEWCEPRGWLGKNIRLVFDIGPHVSGTDLNTAPFVYGSQDANQLLTHTWYQLQMITNPGTQKNGGQGPVDEGYQESYLETACNQYDVGCGIRQAISEWKFWQIQSNSASGRGSITPQHSNLDRILHAANEGGAKTGYWVETYRNAAEKESVGLVIEAFLRAVNAYMVGENGNQGRIATLNRTSNSGKKGDTIKWPSITYNPPYGEYTRNDYTAEILDRLSGAVKRQDGPFANVFPNIATGTLDSLAAQGDLITPDDRDDGYAGEVTNSWPSDHPRWHDLVGYSEQKLALAPGWNFVSSRVAPSDSSIDQVFSDVRGLSAVKNVDGQAYLPQLNINQIGTWSTTEGYKVHVEDAQNTTITGDPVERDTPIELKEGWNLLPYYPGEPMDAATALAPIADAVKVVRDEDGNEYVPSQGTNDIGDLVPGDAYAVYVVTDTTLVYPNP